MLVDVGRKQAEVEREKISARVGPTLGGERPRSSKQSRLVNFFGFGVG